MDESVETQELEKCGSTVTELEVGVIAQGVFIIHPGTEFYEFELGRWTTYRPMDGSFSFFLKRSFRYENDDEKTKNETIVLKTIVL